MEGPWLVDWLWEAHVTFFLLHNKLLQVAIWLGPWIVSLSRVLTTWQTSVCWSVIYLCEAVAEGVRSFGSTLCTRIGSRSIELFGIKIVLWEVNKHWFYKWIIDGKKQFYFKWVKWKLKVLVKKDCILWDFIVGKTASEDHTKKIWLVWELYVFPILLFGM